MAQEQRQIFREKSLQKLSSPDRLDELLRIVNPPAWLLMATVGMGLVLVIVWGIFGRIPSTVQGTAILVHPKRVVSFQARAAGAIESIEISVGDRVKVDDPLARVFLPTLRERRDQEEARLSEIRLRIGKLAELDLELALKEKTHLVAQAEKFDQRIQHLKEAAERARAARKTYISQQRKNVEQAHEKIVELQEKLTEQKEASESLREAKIMSLREYLNAERQQIENELRLAQHEVTRAGIDLQESDMLDAYDQSMDLAQDLEIQRGALVLRELEIDGQIAEAEIVNESEVQEIERNLRLIETQLANQGWVRSEYAGRVIEITVADGQQVAIGQLLGKLEIEDPEANLKALAYFTIKDGKKLRLAWEIRISPTTVERERHGAMEGVITEISDYPVTIEAAANQIGNLEIARTLLGGESRIEVVADLDLDQTSHTGFAWTSGEGPKDRPITAGTTAQVRVTIEERAPITLLLPFLKSLLEDS